MLRHAAGTGAAADGAMAAASQVVEDKKKADHAADGAALGKNVKDKPDVMVPHGEEAAAHNLRGKGETKKAAPEAAGVMSTGTAAEVKAPEKRSSAAAAAAAEEEKEQEGSDGGPEVVPVHEAPKPPMDEDDDDPVMKVMNAAVDSDYANKLDEVAPRKSAAAGAAGGGAVCLLYTSPSPRDRQKSRMPSSA